MTPSKTLLFLIYSTLTCLLIVLSSLLYNHLIWLALPLAFILLQFFITSWLPGDRWMKNRWDQKSLLIRDVNTLTIAKEGHDDANSPTFENYQHIKKILNCHQKRFPNAQVRNIHPPCDNTEHQTSTADYNSK